MAAVPGVIRERGALFFQLFIYALQFGKPLLHVGLSFWPPFAVRGALWVMRPRASGGLYGFLVHMRLIVYREPPTRNMLAWGQKTST